MHLTWKIILLLGVIGVAGFIFWRIFIFPKIIKGHLEQLFQLISNWYRHIEENFNRGINKKYLAEIEVQIQEFLEKTGLGSIRLFFSPSFQVKFLGSRGFHKHLEDPIVREDLFKKRVGLDATTVDLHIYWLNIKRSFYQFYWNYSGEDFQKYMMFVEAKISLLKLYFKLGKI